MDGSERFHEYLRKRRLRATAERRAVLRAILSLRKHFTIDDLLLRFHRRRRPVSRATLYRTVGHLVECGLVRKLDLGHREAVFEYTLEQEHHEHMICLHCGRVIEFADPEMERLQEEACRLQRFRPVRHFLQVLGYCRQCG